MDAENEVLSYGGLQYKRTPLVIIEPGFAITFQELKNKFQGQNSITGESVLILEENATAVNVNLDGFLIIKGHVTGKFEGPVAVFEEA